jgi:hypothetical protein
VAAYFRRAGQGLKWTPAKSASVDWSSGRVVGEKLTWVARGISPEAAGAPVYS